MKLVMFIAVAAATLMGQHMGNAEDLVVAAAPSRCRTVRGRDCLFPFRYRGQVHYECTFTDTEDGEPWCATAYNSDGLTARPGSYENCDRALCLVGEEDVCRTNDGPDRGNTCKFPFRYNGRTYYGCADWVWGGRYQGFQWCSTQTDARGNHIQGRGFYGMCDCSPPCGCRYNSPTVAFDEGGVGFSAAADSPPAEGDSPQ